MFVRPKMECARAKKGLSGQFDRRQAGKLFAALYHKTHVIVLFSNNNNTVIVLFSSFPKSGHTAWFEPQTKIMNFSLPPR